MIDDNPDNMTTDERLDWILGDNSLGSDSALAALPIAENESIREAVLHSVAVSGIHATQEHWARVLDMLGSVPSAELDAVRVVFNQTICELI